MQVYVWTRRKSHSHYCVFVAAGALVVDCELFGLPSDTILRPRTQTSPRDERAIWLSHCTNVRCNMSPRLGYRRLYMFCDAGETEQHFHCFVMENEMNFLPVISTQQRIRKTSSSTGCRQIFILKASFAVTLSSRASCGWFIVLLLPLTQSQPGFPN